MPLKTNAKAHVLGQNVTKHMENDAITLYRNEHDILELFLLDGVVDFCVFSTVNTSLLFDIPRPRIGFAGIGIGC